ncbi:MAG: hypothetical protein JOZ47_15040 [Kutzneria sp.]|nr:hypothetical protein [Kutzneria sp.]
MGRTKKRAQKVLWRLWGYVLLLAAIYLWTTADVNLVMVLTLSGLAFLYMLFAAPMWCMAPNSTNGNPCSNNARGILIGCWIRKHKWQKVRMVVKRQRWIELIRRSRSSVGAQAATIGAMSSFSSATVTAIALAVRR